MQNTTNIQNQMASALQQQTAMNRTNTNVPTTNWQQQACNVMQQGGATVCPPAFKPNNNQVNNNGNQKNPYRRYENQNYCWTHCHHVEDTHPSATCTMPKPGHQFQATKMNTMGGVNWEIHKTIMPFQSGCPRDTRPQRPLSQVSQMWKAQGFPPRSMRPILEQQKTQRAARRNMQQTPMQQMPMWGAAPTTTNTKQWQPNMQQGGQQKNW